MKFALISNDDRLIRGGNLVELICQVTGATVIPDKENGGWIFTARYADHNTPLRLKGGIEWPYGDEFTQAEVCHHAASRLLPDIKHLGWVLYKRRVEK